jgi:tRNA modification GTPase
LPTAYDKAFYQKYGPVISISAKTKEGVEELKQEIERRLADTSLDLRNDRIVTNARHFESLTRAKESAREAADGLARGFTFDVVSIDIQSAIEQLGEITGASVSDEMIEHIFSRFCIGK